MFAEYIVFVKVTLDNSLSYFVTTEAEITNNVIGFLSSVSETIQRAFFLFFTLVWKSFQNSKNNAFHAHNCIKYGERKITKTWQRWDSHTR